jgi:hypothetical protein
MKKHLIIFLAYEHLDIISKSFESIKNADADIFIIENQSVNSKAIADYFEDKNHIGYIQFHENVANSSVSIFIADYWNLIEQYEYVTFTDGDLYVYDVKKMFDEIFDAFKNPSVIISSADLWQGNNYLNTERLGLERFINECKCNKALFGSTQGHTGNFFITIKHEDINLLRMNKLYLDSFLAESVNALNRSWFKVNRNKVYHLTWDLYYEGNPYFEFKKQVADKIWFKEHQSGYDILKQLT